MRRWAANLILLCATLALLEWLIGRVLGGTEQVVLYDPSGGTTGCCGQLRPNASADYTGWFLRIPRIRQEVNALGYRGPERQPDKQDDVLRIVAIGDSYTYGLGTASAETIPAQLEALINQAGGRSVEVLNFGVPGSQLADMIERTRCFAARWHPEIVLYFMYADDLEPPLCEWKAVAALGERLARGDVRALTSDWRTSMRLMEGFATWKSSLVRAGLLAYLLSTRWATAVDDDSWTPVLERHLHALVEATQQSGATLVVVALGDPSAYRRSPRLGEILSRQGVRWIDGREWLFGSPAQRLPVIPRDGHFNAAGNRTAARQVASWLVDAGVLSERTAQLRHERGS